MTSYMKTPIIVLDVMMNTELPMHQLMKFRADVVDRSGKELQEENYDAAWILNNLAYNATYRLWDVAEGSGKESEARFLELIANEADIIQTQLNNPEENK